MKAIKFILLALLLMGEAFASQPGLMRANHDYILNQFGIENNESSKNVVAGIFRAINASDRKQFKHIVTSQSHNAYLVKSEVDNIEAPEFLLYLAMVESHLKNTVTSGASAGGMWQLMPATAKNFGLRVDSAVDERRDPAASTDAAFSYILHLKQNFGKWYLAHAKLSELTELKNAIAATGSDDLDRLLKSPALPNETKNFIKRIIKYAYIAQNENMRKILLFESEPWGLKRIAVAPGTKLSAVAKQIGISPSQMQDYNAHIKNGISPLNGKYFFYIPQSKYAEFVVNQGAFQAYEPRLKQRKPGRVLAGLANELSLKDKNEIALNNIKFNK